MSRMDISLDTALPDQVPRILRNAAQQYRESASELASAWQDESAGKVWDKYAAILERAAAQCEREWRKVS